MTRAVARERHCSNNAQVVQLGTAQLVRRSKRPGPEGPAIVQVQIRRCPQGPVGMPESRQCGRGAA
jgi:hypothetical protein